MVTPKTIFIDTCVFDQNHYNFESNDFKILLSSFKKHEVTLLMPHPVWLEMNRHMEEMAQSILAALNQAQRAAPFLTKVPSWPARNTRDSLVKEILATSKKNLEKFLDHYNVVNLDYEGVSISQIMRWQNDLTPPFSKEKPNEFRDAVSLSSLLAYARKNKEPIAIISGDSDFKHASALHINLLYFPSIVKYMEYMVGGDERIDEIRSVIDSEGLQLDELVKSTFPNLGFIHDDDYDADIEDVTVHDVEVADCSIVHVGDDECVISVLFMIGYSAYVTMDDPESGYYDSDDRIHRALFQLRGTIQDSCQIRALAKCKVSSDWSKIESVGSFSFADEFVSVSERPTGDDEDDGDYDYEDSPPGDASEDFKDRLDEKGEIIPPPY